MARKPFRTVIEDDLDKALDALARASPGYDQPAPADPWKLISDVPLPLRHTIRA